MTINVAFPQAFLGTPADIDTLALVVPDLRTSQPFVLIGTNTLDLLYDKYTDPQSFYSVSHGYRAVLKILELRHRLVTSDHHGIIKLHAETAQIIPARQTVALEDLVSSSILQTEKTVLVQHPTSFAVTGGLMVQSCIVDLPRYQPYHLPVVICNQSDHDVTIPPRAAIAEISAVQSIQCKEQSVPEPESHLPTPSFNFNFGNSPLSPEWKHRIIKKLNSIPDVFAKHDLDFGRTDYVKHQIV